MTSAIDIMALSLLTQLTARGYPAPSIEECKAILRDVIDDATKVADEAGRRMRETSPA